MSSEAELMAEKFRAGKVDLATLCGLEDDEVESGYQRGRSLLENGLAEQASKVLLGVAIMRPTEPRYVRALGFAYQHMNRHASAYEAFNIAVHLDPKDGVALLMRAECALASRDQAQGRALLEAALTQTGDDSSLVPYRQRAQALLRMLQTR